MNPAGILLDTGPLVALLSRDDADHSRAEQLFSECLPPFRCCEAVIAENRWQGTISLIARGGDLPEDRLEFGEIVPCH
ncbi:MAG: hypothetical protein ABSH28_01530 [Acidobacteriota bacterium]|jgi:predicted nucleic acid-binding protein